MHKLVVIGDSVSQGFQSGAISRTRLSYPALLAKGLGIPDAGFRVPDFAGEGGLPMNLEALLGLLAREYGETISLVKLLLAMDDVRRMMDLVEDYWERQGGTQASPTGPLHHNSAVWGFEVGDADTLSQIICRRNSEKPRDNFFKQIPQDPMYRTAERTLNPSLEHQHAQATQVGVAQAFARDGGIENLVFWLGGNNALATVTELDAEKASTPEDLLKLPHERDVTLWRPEDFDAAYERVATQVEAVGAKHVFVGTIPHVTIPPITRGVSLNTPERVDGYYEYYTRFWTWDEDFKERPGRFKSINRGDARRIDQTIDRYNDTIRAFAAQRPNWHVVEFGDVLSRMAYRRQAGQPTYQFPQGLIDALERKPELAYLVDRSSGQPRVKLDTRFLKCQSGSERIVAGGIFSLDGIHPSTVGYGIMAHELLQVMNRAWVADGQASVQLAAEWWDHVVGSDSLLNDPPENLNALRELLGFLGQRGGPLRELMHVLSGSVLR